MRFPPEKPYFSYKITIKKAFRTVKKKHQSHSGHESESAVATSKNAKKRKPQRGASMTGVLRRPQEGRGRSAPYRR